MLLQDGARAGRRGDLLSRGPAVCGGDGHTGSEGQLPRRPGEGKRGGSALEACRCLAPARWERARMGGHSEHRVGLQPERNQLLQGSRLL